MSLTRVYFLWNWFINELIFAINELELILNQEQKSLIDVPFLYEAFILGIKWENKDSIKRINATEIVIERINTQNGSNISYTTSYINQTHPVASNQKRNGALIASLSVHKAFKKKLSMLNIRILI